MLTCLLAVLLQLGICTDNLAAHLRLVVAAYGAETPAAIAVTVSALADTLRSASTVTVLTNSFCRSDCQLYCCCPDSVVRYQGLATGADGAELPIGEQMCGRSAH